jgi:hypothetical protein
MDLTNINVSVSSFEKKHLAEFNTPPEFIEKMLDTLPSDFWSSPKKIFEPCAGKGLIIFSLFNRFFKSLKDFIISDEERKIFIIEHCLFFADINPDNIAIIETALRSLSSKTDILINSFCGNSLNYIATGFDLVISNPPFNTSEDNKNVIWPQFIRTSLESWIADNGCLLFITPPGWRKPDKERSKYSGLFNLMTKKNTMLHLQMHSKKDGRSTFKCNTFFDWYLIQNKININSLTNIIDELGEKNVVQMHKWTWFPSANIPIVQKLIGFGGDEEERCPIIYSRSAYGTDKAHVQEKEDNKHPFICIHSTLKKSTRYMYSSIDSRGHFGIKKVIFGESGIYNPIIDMEGKYGMTHCAMAIQIETLEEGEKICKAITSPKFTELMKTSCILSSFRIEWSIFSQFRKSFYKEFI